jgi:hypothetical protein
MRIIPILIFLLLFSCSVGKRNLDPFQFVPNAAFHTFEADSFVVANADEDIVYLNYYTGFDHYTQGHTWKIDKHYVREYIVNNPDNNTINSFKSVIYRGQSLKDVKLMIIRPDSIRSFGYADLAKTEGEDGETTYKFAYPNLKKGDIIRETFRKYILAMDTPETTVRFGYPIAPRFPAKNLVLEVAFPKAWEMQIKANGPGDFIDFKKRDDKKNNKTNWTYTAENVKPYKNEPYSVSMSELGLYAYFKFNDLVFGGIYNTDFRYSDPNLWSNVASFYEKRIIDREAWFSSTLENATEEAVAGAKSHKMMTENVINWIKETIVMDPKFGATSFEKVLTEKKGNPYTICGLSVAMLLENDINATFVVVHPRSAGYLDKDFVSYEQFPIPAVQVQIEDESFFYFPYEKYMPNGMIPEALAGEEAMVIYSRDVFKRINKTRGRLRQNQLHRFIRLPADENALSRASETFHLTLNEEDELLVRESKKAMGIFAVGIREELAKKNAEELDDYFNEAVTYDNAEIDDLKYAIHNLDAIEDTLELTLNYKVDNLLSETPDEIILQLGGLFASETFNRFKIEKEDRNNPIQVLTRFKYEKKLIFDYPDTWKLVNLPLAKSVSNQFGELVLFAEDKDGKVSITIQRHIHKSQANSDKIKDFIQLLGKESITDVNALVFTRKPVN